MPKITRPASLVRQGDLILYSTSLKVADLLIPNFYNIERLDPENAEGYQRVLNTSRAKKLADYIVAGMESRDAFLPTSIFMATNEEMPFNPANNTIEIDTNLVCPFSIVDGQHRAEGLKIAAEKDERVKEFEIPVNIAVQLSELAQMSHFLIVNTTQKSVDEGIAQRIRARLSQAVETEPLPTLPRWIARLVEKGEDASVLQLVDYLNVTGESPWKDRIFMANDDGKKSNRVTQKSFVTLIKKHYFLLNNPVCALNYPEDKQKKILLNYWKAIANIIGNDDSVLFRYVGAQLFSMFAVPFFNKMVNIQNSFQVDVMQEVLQKCFDAAEGEATGSGHSDFWVTGGKASGLNSGAVSKVCQKLVIALHSSSNPVDDI